MSDPLISQTLGNYEIVSKLGKGGMATVYRARQRNMQRDVAIKVMSADLAADPEFVARFEREAHVIARLEHPRILPVHDFGHEGELFYLVMRLVEGESLYYRLKRGPLPLKTVARYLSQIAEALDYAHAEGVSHRDLKPNNILIDQWDNLYLMDFGLAKIMAATQSLTQTGVVLGTPAYMAPEVWRGEPVDARTDVYALGVILYEMVLGHTPFESDTPFTLMYKHINDPPPAPRDAMPDLPVEVEQVILKALAKDKDARYQSAGDLARAFNEVMRVAGTLPERVHPPDQPAVAPSEPEAAPEGAALPAAVFPVAEEEGHLAAEEAALPAAKPDIAPPEEIVPPPAHISPPPPPLPLPPDMPFGAGRRKPSPYEAGDSQVQRKQKTRSGGVEVIPASQALRQAMAAIDQAVDAAVEKVAEAVPPLPGAESADAAPSFAGPDVPAMRAVSRALRADEPVIGVIDVRGTTQWRLWKRFAVGGLVLNILGGVLNAGLLSVLGWMAWVFLAVQLFRTWRGVIGQYYLGCSAERLVLLPHDADGTPLSGERYVASWAAVERLRLSDRYVLADLTLDDGETISFAGLLVMVGAGGLGEQARWLPGSPLVTLLSERGFEVHNL
jgi:serine/threonine-protein kinase